MEVDLYSNEKRLWHLGYQNIAGCDEAGRGPLFGPVVAASVILPHDFVLEGLNDSKKLSEKKREKYYPIIMEKNNGENILWKKNKIRNIRKKNSTEANCFLLISIRVRSRWIFRRFLFTGIKKWN